MLVIALSLSLATMPRILGISFVATQHEDGNAYDHYDCGT
jgi:hypothetical protein